MGNAGKCWKKELVVIFFSYSSQPYSRQLWVCRHQPPYLVSVVFACNKKCVVEDFNLYSHIDPNTQTTCIFAPKTSNSNTQWL